MPSMRSLLNHLASTFATAVLAAIRRASLEELVGEPGGRAGRRPGPPTLVPGCTAALAYSLPPCPRLGPKRAFKGALRGHRNSPLTFAEDKYGHPHLPRYNMMGTVLLFALPALLLGCKNSIGRQLPRNLYACEPPSCLLVFEHPHFNKSTPFWLRKQTLPINTEWFHIKVSSDQDGGTRLRPSYIAFDSCQYPSCYLAFQPVAGAPLKTRNPLDPPEIPQIYKMKSDAFVGSDGTPIKPYYGQYGELNAASGRDTKGIDHDIRFYTNIERRRISHPAIDLTRFPNGKICRNGHTGKVVPEGELGAFCSSLIPPGCDSFGCDIFKTTATAIYSEQAVDLFEYQITVDAFNSETQIRITRNATASGPTLASSVHSLRYLTRMDGTGEEHIVDNANNDAITTFTIDRENSDKPSIAPKFAVLFPEIAGASYFAEMFSQMFINATTLSSGQSLSTQSGTINWAAASGDFAIALAIGISCASGPVGCALAGAVGAVGVDVWHDIEPGVIQDDTGRTIANRIVLQWWMGLCEWTAETLAFMGLDPPSCL
jgi:hypothetical protein